MVIVYGDYSKLDVSVLCEFHDLSLCNLKWHLSSNFVVKGSHDNPEHFLQWSEFLYAPHYPISCYPLRGLRGLRGRAVQLPGYCKNLFTVAPANQYHFSTFVVPLKGQVHGVVHWSQSKLSLWLTKKGGLVSFSKTHKLWSSKAPFTNVFFAAFNHNYYNKQWMLKQINTQNGSKSTNHKSRTMTFWTR